MRRPITVTISIVLMASLFGCGGVSESDHRTVVFELEALKGEIAKLHESFDSMKKEYRALERQSYSLAEEVVALQQETAQLKATKGAEPRRPKQDQTPETHKVNAGDTLWSISQQYGIPTARLQKLNDLPNANIKAGQEIRLR